MMFRKRRKSRSFVQMVPTPCCRISATRWASWMSLPRAAAGRAMSRNCAKEPASLSAGTDVVPAEVQVKALKRRRNVKRSAE